LLPNDPAIHQYQNIFDILGPGEATAIILASQLKAGLLIDEKLGRKAAQKMNLHIIGTAGVLLLAKEKK
jgi:predicted nucleic acid-binding protein